MNLLLAVILAQSAIPNQRTDVFGPAMGGLMTTMGLVPGASAIAQFGRNPDIDTGTVPEDIWGGDGVYPGFPITAGGMPYSELLEVLSSSALDTAAGTGARRVRIWGLGATGKELIEFVDLNGTTPVPTVNQFTRVYVAEVTTTGSTNLNQGTITVRHATTESNIFATMAPGENRDMLCTYTVPSDSVAYLRQLNLLLLSGASGAIRLGLWVRPTGWPGSAIRIYNQTDAYAIFEHILAGVRFEPNTDVTVRVFSSATSNVSLSCTLDFIVIKNPG